MTRWDRAAIAVEAALLVLFLVGLSTSGAAGHAAVGPVLGGPYTAEF